MQSIISLNAILAFEKYSTKKNCLWLELIKSKWQFIHTQTINIDLDPCLLKLIKLKITYQIYCTTLKQKGAHFLFAHLHLSNLNIKLSENVSNQLIAVQLSPLQSATFKSDYTMLDNLISISKVAIRGQCSRRKAALLHTWHCGAFQLKL